MTEELFAEMLNLGDKWEVSKIEVLAEHSCIEVTIKDTAKLLEGLGCPSCNGEDLIIKDHASERQWDHLQMWTYKTVLKCRLPRALCKSCNKTWTIRAPWEGVNKHSSKDFEALALTLMRHMPVSKVGKLMKVDDQKLWRILRQYIDKERAKLDWSELTRIGVDELSIAKGHRYVSVFVDMENHSVLFAADGKDAQVFEQFTEELYLKNGHPHAITEVSMDMSPSYKSGVDSNMRNARKVFDYFHIAQNLNKAIGKVCSRERRRKGDIRKLLKKPRLFQKNRDNLKEKDHQTIEKLKELNTATAMAYQMRLSLQDIFKMKSEIKALLGLKAWISWVHNEAEKEEWKYFLNPLKKFAESLTKHFDGIIARWRHGTSNAVLEGINSVFSAVKRRARGFRSKEYLKMMLYFTKGNLTGIPNLIPSK